MKILLYKGYIRFKVIPKFHVSMEYPFEDVELVSEKNPDDKELIIMDSRLYSLFFFRIWTMFSDSIPGWLLSIFYLGTIAVEITTSFVDKTPILHIVKKWYLKEFPEEVGERSFFFLPNDDPTDMEILFTGTDFVLCYK